MPSSRLWPYVLAGLLSLCAASSLWGQSGEHVTMSIDLGYQAHLESPDGLNFVADRYNETRDFLTEEMDSFGYFDGLTGSVGIYLSRLYFDLGFNLREQERAAEGTTNGTSVRRALRVSSNSVYFSMAAAVQDNGIYSPFGLSVVTIGARAELGTTRFSTRVGTTSEIDDQDWAEISDEMRIYAGPFVKIGLGPLMIEPYYLFDVDFGVPGVGLSPVNEAINPATFQRDPDNLAYGGGGFGLRIAAVVYLNAN